MAVFLMATVSSSQLQKALSPRADEAVAGNSQPTLRTILLRFSLSLGM